MGFSRQEYGSGLSFPSPEDLPDAQMEPGSPALQADSFLTELPRKPNYVYICIEKELENSPNRIVLEVEPLLLSLHIKFLLFLKNVLFFSLSSNQVYSLNICKIFKCSKKDKQGQQKMFNLQFSDHRSLRIFFFLIEVVILQWCANFSKVTQI